MGSLQLRRRIRELASRVVGAEEGVALQQCRQGLPTSSWWVCLRNCAGVLVLAPKKVWQQRVSACWADRVAALAFVPSSGVRLKLRLPASLDVAEKTVVALAFVPSSGVQLPFANNLCPQSMTSRPMSRSFFPLQ